jgi:hypothetical protein
VESRHEVDVVVVDATGIRQSWGDADRGLLGSSDSPAMRSNAEPKPIRLTLVTTTAPESTAAFSRCVVISGSITAATSVPTIRCSTM